MAGGSGAETELHPMAAKQQMCLLEPSCVGRKGLERELARGAICSGIALCLLDKTETG